MLKFNFLIIDDNEITLTLLNILLKDLDFCNQVYLSTSGSGGLQLLKSDNIDIVVLDYLLPDTQGDIIAESIRSNYPHIKIIMITSLEGEFLTSSLLKINVHSILYKSLSLNKIVEAIRNVSCENKVYFPESIQKLLNNSAGLKVPDSIDREIIKAIANGVSTKQLSSLCNISVRTVETRRSRLLKKLGVKNTAELIAFAFRNGILQ
jgi:DNA-binding NarL/FixJ family response regulator